MGKFVIKEVKTGHNFILKANNGETIATSEVYKSLASCKHSIDSVRTNSTAASLEDQTVRDFETEKNPKFEVYKDKSDKFRFRLKAHNGEEIAASGAYKAKSSCLKGIASIRKNAPKAEIIIAVSKTEN